MGGGQWREGGREGGGKGVMGARAEGDEVVQSSRHEVNKSWDVTYSRHSRLHPIVMTSKVTDTN